MNDTWDKFEKKFKAIAKKSAKMKESDAKSIREDIKKSLKLIWKTEEVVEGKVAEAVEDGATGKKPKDFLSNADYRSEVGDWEKMVEDHVQRVKDLETISLEARGYLKELAKDFEAAIKSLKSDKLLDDAKNPKFKKFAAQKTIVEIELKKLEAIDGYFSTLKLPEVLYGKKGFDKKKLQAMVDAGLKEAKGGAELPKILELKEGERNIKVADEYELELRHLQTKIEEVKDDKKLAARYMKESTQYMAKIKKLSASYSSAMKKMAAEIAKSENKDKIEKIVKQIADIEKDCAETLKKSAKLAKSS